MSERVVILGVFVADTTYRAARLPRAGETILGEAFALGPGGKGSNQAVAAARAGGEAHMLTKLGRDPFGEMARATWREAGVRSAATLHDEATGAAFIYVDAATGDNAIIVCPGVAGTLSPADVEAQADLIAGARVLLTQLEQPIPAAMRALEIARAAGVTTILNPAPAAPLPDGMLALCDLVTPNESEAEALTGLPVRTIEEAEAAARALRAMGAGAVVVTLGERGALYHDGARCEHVPAATPERWWRRRAPATPSTAPWRWRSSAATTRSWQCASAARPRGSPSRVRARRPRCPPCTRSRR